jgi:hypothetical protein
MAWSARLFPVIADPKADQFTGDALLGFYQNRLGTTSPSVTASPSSPTMPSGTPLEIRE